MGANRNDAGPAPADRPRLTVWTGAAAREAPEPEVVDAWDEAERGLAVDRVRCYCVGPDGRLIALMERHPLADSTFYQPLQVFADPRLARGQLARQLRRIADAVERHDGFFAPGEEAACELPGP